MIRRLDARALGVEHVVRLLERAPAGMPAGVQRTVDDILADVRARGDAALVELTARLDGFAARTPAALDTTG